MGTDHKNIGEYMTTMLASGRVSGKVHRWMASLGEGFVRGIKELRYIRGEENWIADALSRSLQQEKGEGSVDPSVKACLDFFFSEESRVKYRRGKKCDDFDGWREGDEGWDERINLAATSVEGRGHLYEIGRWMGDKGGERVEEVECMVKRALKPKEKKLGTSRKGGEKSEDFL